MLVLDDAMWDTVPDAAMLAHANEEILRLRQQLAASHAEVGRLQLALHAPLAAEGSGDGAAGSIFKTQACEDNVPIFSSSDTQQDALDRLKKANRSVLKHSLKEMANGEHAAGHSHGHGEKSPSLLSAVVSGVINFLLMFGMCCAFGMIMFDETNAKWQPLGVKMNLVTSAFCGLIVAMFSKIPVAIAGPDLNPVVFIANFIATMAPAIAQELRLSYPGGAVCGRRLEEAEPLGLESAAEAFGARLLGGGGGACASEAALFCKEGSDGYDAAMCEMYDQQLVTTTIFAVAVSSAALGLILFIFGRFNLVRYVSFVPTSISEAFLSCVGYKVFAYALKFCNYKPQQFLPAGLIGVILYFIKANHIGNPAVVIPAILLIPLAIFHSLVAAGVFYEGLESAREANIMFPYMENTAFYTMWEQGIYDGTELKFQYINFSAWVKTIPDLLTMIIVVMIDCLLKIKNTENKLPIVPQPQFETQLHAATNMLMFACGSPCGYMQLKFNVINFGILGNATDRRGGIVYALLCAVCFFWTIGPFNYLPRFFLGMLLFFAGAGFVAENLWGSRKFLSFNEWLEVLFILIVFIVSGQLLYAVVAGLLLTAVGFITKYAKVPVITREPISGGDIASYARRGPLLQLAIRHIADVWFFVVPVKGYIFFASAKKVAKIVSDSLQVQREFTISVEAKGSEALGIHVRDFKDGKSLLVTNIYGDGLVANWNNKFPLDAVKIGDRIVAAKAKSSASERGIGRRISASQYADSCEELREEMEKSGPLNLRIHRESHPAYKRKRFIIIDCHRLDGMDASACDIFRKMVLEAEKCGTTFLWSKLPPQLKQSMQDKGIIRNSEDTCFSELEHAVFRIEEMILNYRKEMLQKWLQVHNGLAAYHHHMNVAGCFEPFTHVFETDAERRGCPWMYCSRVHMRRYRTVLWGPDTKEDCLFLVHSGSVGVYDDLPHGAGMFESEGPEPTPTMEAEDEDDDDAEGEHHPEDLPTAVYEHGWFLNRDFLLRRQPQGFGVAMEDGEVLIWTREQWGRMSRERPLMASAIVRAVMRQQSRESDNLSKANARFREGAKDDCPKRSRSGLGSAVGSAGSGSDTAEEPEPVSPPQDALDDSAHMFAPHLPHEARVPLLALESVRALDALGLWEAPDPSEDIEPAARLPNAIREDLSRAFHLYCERGEVGSKLYPKKIAKALMFAGIFGIELNLANAKPLSHMEFIDLGHEALISRLTAKQKQRLLQLFNDYDDDGSGTLDRQELPIIFLKEFNIHAAEIDSIAREVDTVSYHNLISKGDGQINDEGFLWIVARLVRTHEKEYMLMKTLRELTGNPDCTEEAELSVDMLKESSQLQLQEDEWEEMFWAMDLSSGSTDTVDPQLDFSELMTMLVAQDSVGGKLPLFDVKPFVWEQRPGPPSAAPRGKETTSQARQMVRDQRVDLPTEVPSEEVQDSAESWQLLNKAFEAWRRAWLHEEEDKDESNPAASRDIKRSASLNSFASAISGMSGGGMSRDWRPPDWRDDLCEFMEDPDSSRTAWCFSIFIDATIVLCVLNLVAATIMQNYILVDWSSPFWILDVLFAVAFTTELVLRVIGSKLSGMHAFVSFFSVPRNLVDFIAICPPFWDLALESTTVGDGMERLLRLAQLARMSRLARNWELASPVAVVLVVIWGIYLKESASYSASTC